MMSVAGQREFAMNAILEMRGISKSFPGVKALRDVNLAV
jgi:ABC-type sugar transport system ATPase subunit